MPNQMFLHAIPERAEAVLRGVSQGVLLAAAIALGAWLLGRLLKRPKLIGAAAAMALAVGFALASRTFPWHPLGWPGRLAIEAVAAFVLALIAERSGGGRTRWLLLATLSLASGWWLAGAPLVRPGWPLLLMMVAVALYLAAMAEAVRDAREPWPVVAAAFALWAALHLASAPALFAQLALVTLGACAGLLPVPRGRIPTLWPAAFGIGGVAVAAVLASGRMPRGGLDRIDVAALAPLLVFLLARWLRPSVARSGGMVASGIAAVAAVLLIWGVGGLTR